MDFLPQFFYSSQGSRIFYVLNWKAALHEESGLAEVDKYHNMKALKRNYHFPNIMFSEDFLRENRCFYVIDYQSSRWFDIKIKYNKNYNVTKLKDNFFKVCKN
jgi:hypothetical protein